MTSQVTFHFLKKQTRITLRKLIELDLFVLSFVQNYDLLKYYAINLKNIAENVSGSNQSRTQSPQASWAVGARRDSGIMELLPLESCG